MPVTSSSSSVKRWPATEAVLDALRAWAEAEAAARPDLEALGYFGSYARGDEGFGSDLDLVAVVAASSLPRMERPRLWQAESLPVPTDLLVYTADEWESLQEDGGRFARVLATETVWLVDRWPARREARMSGRSPSSDSSAREDPKSTGITRGIGAFMTRDWPAARDAKDAYWAERVGRLGPLEALRCNLRKWLIPSCICMDDRQRFPARAPAAPGPKPCGGADRAATDRQDDARAGGRRQA